MFNALRNKLSEFTSWQVPRSVSMPIITSQQQAELMVYAQNLAAPLFSILSPSSHTLLGDSVSLQRGQGYEFDDNRLYQAGDETRLLNWRLYARLGELYTRIMNEERRSCLFIIADRSSSMRFGTRKQLKVTLAAKLAACYAWQARSHGYAVGGVVINDAPGKPLNVNEWFSPQTGQGNLSGFLSSLYSPCPPTEFASLDLSSIQNLNTQLQHCIETVPGGSHVLLLSDFNYFYSDAVRLQGAPEIQRFVSLLQGLSASHNVQAIQVLDVAEVELAARLPETDELYIETTGSDTPVRVSAKSPELNEYTDISRQKDLELDRKFKLAGITLRHFNTAQDYTDCITQLVTHHE